MSFTKLMRCTRLRTRMQTTTVFTTITSIPGSATSRTKRRKAGDAVLQTTPSIPPKPAEAAGRTSMEYRWDSIYGTGTIAHSAFRSTKTERAMGSKLFKISTMKGTLSKHTRTITRMYLQISEALYTRGGTLIMTTLGTPLKDQLTTSMKMVRTA